MAGDGPEEALRLLERFHGHLGPYLVLGYRMGVAARRELCAGPFDLVAEVCSGRSPPMSCMADGIQVGAGCTTGKGTLRVRGERRCEAMFMTRGGRGLRARVLPEALGRINVGATEAEVVALSRELMVEPEERLLAIEPMGATSP